MKVTRIQAYLRLITLHLDLELQNIGCTDRLHRERSLLDPKIIVLFALSFNTDIATLLSW